MVEIVWIEGRVDDPEICWGEGFAGTGPPLAPQGKQECVCCSPKHGLQANRKRN
jgi:hypothetical protein